MAAKHKNVSFPNWHPNFTIQATLPDVKVVRTGFLVNFVALTFPVLLIGLILVDWMDAQGLQQQIETRKQLLEGAIVENKKNVEKSKEFDIAAAKLNDVEGFLSGNLDELEVIVAIAESRPKAIALNNISYSEMQKKVGKKMVLAPRITLRGVLKGTSADEVSMLDEYKATLKNLPVFAGILDDVTLPEPTQDIDKDLSRFSITIDLKAADE